MTNQDPSRYTPGNLESVVRAKLKEILSENLSYNEAAGVFRRYLRDLSRRANVHPVAIIDQVIKMRNLGKTALGESDGAIEFLNAYRVSAINQRRKGTSRQIADASQGRLVLDGVLLNEIALMQNRARGKTYEKMGANLIKYYLRDIEKYDGPINIIADKTTFECPDSSGKASKRRFDLFLPDFLIGVEIKSGPISYSRGIRDQIFKDRYLLQNTTVREVLWFLFYGGSQKVLAALLDSKISFMDLGFNDFDG